MSTAKIVAWSRLLSRLVWLVVLCIIAAAFGRWVIPQQPSSTRPSLTSKPLPRPAVDWRQVDHEVVQSLKEAASVAEGVATQKLTAWTNALMERVDGDFLGWYFGYWNQQVLGLKAMWYWSVSQILSEAPAAVERITEDIQAQFATRVLRPEIAQLELERITNDVLQVYVTRLSAELALVPEKYQIPRPDWERYLDDIAVMAARTEGNRDVPLTLKVLTASTAAGAMTLGKSLAPLFPKIGATVSGKLLGTAAGKMAAKTGAKVGAKTGGKFLGTIIGIGVIIWDVWDHQRTKHVERPILRQAIADYFAEMQQHLLHEPESGIMTILQVIEGSMLSSLRKQS